VNGQRFLNICVIGVSSSIHIQRRSVCFAERGHRVTVISPVPFALSGVANRVVPCRWGKYKFGILKYIFLLCREIQKTDPDIVHIHYAGIYEMLAAYFSNKPYVVTMMGSDILKKLDGDYNYFKKTLMLFCLKRARLLNPVSEIILTVIEKHIGKQKNILKVAWGIDPDVFKPYDKKISRQKFGFEENCLYILSPRLIKPLYNTDIIVKAFAKVSSQKNIKLILCSYNSNLDYLEKIKKLIDKLGLVEDVVILGPVKNEEMPFLYSAADVSVMIPNSDGLPISLLESMACGLPNILPNLPFCREVIEKDISAVCVDINVESVRSAMELLCYNEKKRMFLSDNSRNSVANKWNFKDDVLAIEKQYFDIVCG